MYVKFYLATSAAYHSSGIIGGALTMAIVDDSTGSDVTIEEMSLKATAANSSELSLDLFTIGLKMINPGSIHSIQYVPSKKNDYMTTALFSLNKWKKNGMRDVDGNLLKNVKKVNKFIKALSDLKVKTIENGEEREIDLPVVVIAREHLEKEEAEMTKKVYNKIYATAQLVARETFKENVHCTGEVLYKKVQEA